MPVKSSLREAAQSGTKVLKCLPGVVARCAGSTPGYFPLPRWGCQSVRLRRKIRMKIAEVLSTHQGL